MKLKLIKTVIVEGHEVYFTKNKVYEFRLATTGKHVITKDDKGRNVFFDKKLVSEFFLVNGEIGNANKEFIRWWRNG